MPSIETEVASVVCQESCTWSPAEMTVGVAVNCAVGAGVTGGGAEACGATGCFFLHPDTATMARSRTTGTYKRFFKGITPYGISNSIRESGLSRLRLHPLEGAALWLSSPFKKNAVRQVKRQSRELCSGKFASGRPNFRDADLTERSQPRRDQNSGAHWQAQCRICARPPVHLLQSAHRGNSITSNSSSA